MRMPKPVKKTKTVALSAAYDRAAVKRMLTAMETFMAVDSASNQIALTQRAA